MNPPKITQTHDAQEFIPPPQEKDMEKWDNLIEEKSKGAPIVSTLFSSSKITHIRKRDGRVADFSKKKIADAIYKAAQAVGGEDRRMADGLAGLVAFYLENKFPESIPAIEEIQDVVEKVLIETGHTRTAKAYILYREQRLKAREHLKVRKAISSKSSSTDLLLLVTPSAQDQHFAWDKKKIIEALIKEAQIPAKLAGEIATTVEKKIIKAGVTHITTSLIRELVDNELFERGQNAKLEKTGLLGMSRYDLDQLIHSKSLENSNISANNPEAVNLSIAESVLKQYALKEVFSSDVAQAHLDGALHLHDIGYPTRVYCSSHSLEYIKKYGLHLDNLSTVSGPAKHAGTLTGHLNTFLASMQAYYAGALGIGYINIFYAPYLTGMGYNQMKQIAQHLIFSCSQNAFSRGGQTLFIDFNIHLGVPDYLKKVPAIGSGGKYMLRTRTGEIEYLDEVLRDKEENLLSHPDGEILTYAHFEKEVQEFGRVLMDVWREGDGEGKVFPFPKLDLHINQDSFDDPKQKELLDYACLIASENGSPYFVFDRSEVTLSMCCRLRTQVTDNYMITHPESMRFCGFQNVSLNLPQAAYRAGAGKVEKTVEEINKVMRLAMKAHLQKKGFISKIADAPGKPLWQIGRPTADGRPYVDLDKSTYIIGLVGLNECVKHLTGSDLHENDEAYKTGLKVISAMYLKAKEFEKKYGLKVTLEESPAESASLRFAKIDSQKYPESKRYIRGNQETGEIYYTNSVHFTADAPIDIIERIEKQGNFNPLIESGAITHVFLGEQKPDPKAIFNLVKKTWENTQSAQITISPEFTVCNDCRKVSRGYKRS